MASPTLSPAALSPAAAPKTIQPPRPQADPWSFLVEAGLLVLMDGGLLLSSLLAGMLMRTLLADIGMHFVPLKLSHSWVGYFVCWCIWLAALFYEGAYSSGLAALDRTDRIVKGLTGGLAVTILVSFAFHKVISRFVLAMAYGLSLLLFTLLRASFSHRVARLTGARSSVYLVGSGALASSAARALTAAGFAITRREVDQIATTAGSDLDPVRTAVICLDSHEQRVNRVVELESHCDEVGVVTATAGFGCVGGYPINLRGIQMLVITHPLSRTLNQFIKRGCDIVGAALLLIALAPVFALIVAAIKLDTPGPAFFGHPRYGTGGRTFRMWKFRTMLVDAERRLEDLLARDAHLREEFATLAKLKNDPRVTPFGRFLRRWSLDELPQFWNVLVGDMSLVGPRPIYLESEIAKFGEAYPTVSSVRPGVTGVWQVSGRSDTSYESRRQFDLFYVRRWSLWLDMAILIRTLQAVVLPGAY